MELKEFVSKTIVDIIDGVVNAQEYAESNGAIINPLFYHPQSGVKAVANADSYEYRKIDDINFDLVVTESASDKAKGGGGITSPIITVGATGEITSDNSSTSRIKFSISISLPVKSEPKPIETVIHN